MSQPPRAGAVGAPAVPSTDFSTPTVSGTPVDERKGRHDGRTPLVTGKAAPTQTTQTTQQIPPPQAPPVPHPTPGPIPAPTPGPAAAKAPLMRGPRRAKLQLRHINPWTVLKFSCVLSVALFVVWLLTIGILYGILDAAGVISKVNDTVTTINGSGSKRPVTAGIVLGGGAIVGVVNVVLFIALSTLGSVIYNLCADLVGGIELTLSER
ncbi:MAG TPA: DUF3566 domain-containing protein [Jatrophihabitantaceae bacterium]|nr:DUF3566 domain-containing protein [Jatrophihabitantaceae bacterium]